MCSEEMRTLLSKHLDGCNTPEEESVLQQHLNKCEECRQMLADYELINNRIADLIVDPPKSLTDNIMKEIDVEIPKPKKQYKLPIRYATLIAAAAAIFLFVVSTGKISLPNTGATAINYEIPTKEKINPSITTIQQTTLTVPEEHPNDALHAHIDCEALAQQEGIPVAVLYTEDVLQTLASAPSLHLSGGIRYTITQAQLDSIRAEYNDLIIYEPEAFDRSENDIAYLIVIKAD